MSRLPLSPLFTNPLLRLEARHLRELAGGVLAASDLLVGARQQIARVMLERPTRDDGFEDAHGIRRLALREQDASEQGAPFDRLRVVLQGRLDPLAGEWELALLLEQESEGVEGSR